MTDKCIAAFTPNEYPLGIYPPFINASHTPDGKVRVTVRSPAHTADDSDAIVECGDCAAIEMEYAAWCAWVREAVVSLNPEDWPCY